MGVILFVMLFQLWSRYLPSPWAVFVADDWANWARSSFYDSHMDALLTGLQDPNRPISMAAVEVFYRIFGDRPLYWTLLSATANSLLLIFLIQMVWGLTRRRSSAFFAGILFALLPNLTETYHWSTQILNEVACALMFYALSGWMWVDHMRKGGGWRLAVSTAAYMIALFSYEAGILVPVAYAALLGWRSAPIKSLFRLSPYGLILLAYAAWRITGAFGMNQTWYYPPHMEAGISIGGIIWNVHQTVQWWVGDHLFGSLLNGWQSFATLPALTRWGLAAGNIAAVVMAIIVYLRLQEKDRSSAHTFSTGLTLLYALAWTSATLMIPILSYNAPRLNVLPAIGICMTLAIILTRIPWRTWGLVAFVPAVMALVSNQGTAESFRQAGEFNHSLYVHLKETTRDWSSKEVLVLDTRMVRQRLTPGLLDETSMDQRTWAMYHNSLLLRGFSIGGMVRMIQREPIPTIKVLHDVENGVRYIGESCYWHERYDPERDHSLPLEDVYVVELGSIVWMK